MDQPDGPDADRRRIRDVLTSAVGPASKRAYGPSRMSGLVQLVEMCREELALGGVAPVSSFGSVDGWDEVTMRESLRHAAPRLCGSRRFASCLAILTDLAGADPLTGVQSPPKLPYAPWNSPDRVASAICPGVNLCELFPASLFDLQRIERSIGNRITTARALADLITGLVEGYRLQGWGALAIAAGYRRPLRYRPAQRTEADECLDRIRKGAEDRPAGPEPWPGALQSHRVDSLEDYLTHVALQAAERAEVPVCFHVGGTPVATNPAVRPAHDPSALAELLFQYPDLRIVLLVSSVTYLPEVGRLCRNSDRCLVDLVWSSIVARSRASINASAILARIPAAQIVGLGGHADAMSGFRHEWLAAADAMHAAIGQSCQLDEQIVRSLLELPREIGLIPPSAAESRAASQAGGT